MRVNIAYSIDLDDVPNLVKELLKEVVLDFAVLEDTVEGAVLSIEHGGHEKMSKALDDARKRMAKMDARLSECINMYGGYVDALNVPPAQPSLKTPVEKNETTEG